MTTSEADQGTAKPDAPTEQAWAAIVAAAGLTRTARGPVSGQAYGIDGGRLIQRPADDPADEPADDEEALIAWEAAGGWTRTARVSGPSAALFDLYLPFASASRDRPCTVGHLGQSLDGNVATASGDSYFVTGPANLLHLHRMRALCDAVVVGAGTVAADDPRLTPRRVAGDHPLRVVLDPRRRLSRDHGVFQDGDAPTLLVCDADRVSTPGERVGSAQVLGLRVEDGQFDLAELIGALHDRGLYAVFVEGGGRTVSAFLEADRLDRLQVAIAPLITGAGRPGLGLAARDRIRDCLRPAHRIFAMGEDVLFDCNLRDPAGTSENRPRSDDLSRIF